MPPAPKRPTEIRLGFAIWRVSWDKRELDKIRLAESDTSIQAYCNYRDQVLVIEPGSPAGERVRLVHELLHACIATADNYAPATAEATLTEEEMVRDAAPWLLEALVQNPELVAYLLP